MAHQTTVNKKHRPKPFRLGFSLLLIVLLLAVGMISFVYADGLSILYRGWINFITPNIQFNIIPESTLMPANGTSQIYIDLQLKNTQGQLLDGNEIIVNLLTGQANLTRMDNPPDGVSRRVLLQAPTQPQLITLSFTYKYLTKNLAIEAFDPTPPASPALTSPTTGTTVDTATPLVSGQAPADTKVEIYVDNSLNSTMEVNRDGNFSSNLQQAIKRGKHKLVPVTVNKYDIRSILGRAITFDVHTPDPEIDLNNLRIKPNPVQAMTSFRIFVPVSANTQAVTLMLSDLQYPLQDIDKSSVFSGIIPAPKNPGLYRLSLLITTDTGENILAEKVASIQVN